MTGLTGDQVDRLVLDVYAHADLDPTRRRAVGPYRAVLVVLLYLRHNLAQALLAELFGCSQSTVSRLISRLTPAVTTVLTPRAEQVAAP
jgi:Helix-turn-helix of DDE superfamily endonuclease